MPRSRCAAQDVFHPETGEKLASVNELISPETADAIVSVKRDMRDKPVVDQRMKSIRVETNGVEYPFNKL